VFLSASSGGESEITALMVGGQFGGAIEASKSLVDRARRELGLLAIGISKTFNEQHQNGLDLNGQAGGDFFDVGDPLVTGRLNNSGAAVVTATVSDIAALTGDSFTLSYTAEGVRLTNNTSGQTQVLQGSPVDIDGMTLEFSDANPNLVGDEFLIEPTAGAAASFSVVITDGAEIAAAGAGGGVGDNRNVRALIGLGETSPLLNGTRGYRGMYNTTVSNIAVETRSAQANAKTEDALLQSALDRRESVVGVNLEEEAANLIRYQQAYQAAAQVISTANDSFDTLIRATSR
jgi:flagellar hook-associated protein 1 FlgK